MFDQSLLRLIKKKPNRGMSALMDQYTGLVYSAVKTEYRGSALRRISRRFKRCFCCVLQSGG